MAEIRWSIKSARGGGFVLRNSAFPNRCLTQIEADRIGNGPLYFSEHKGHTPITQYGATNYPTLTEARKACKYAPTRIPTKVGNRISG